MTEVEWLLQEMGKLSNGQPTEAMILYAKKLERQQREDAFKEGGEAVSDYLNKEACRQLGISHTKIKL